MNKKLLVAAVAGALAAPGVALAQVTITGKFGAMWQSMKYSGATGAVAGNRSVTGISDNTSTLTFRAREDLGGGLAAYGQFEFRPLVDSNTTAGAAAGNVYAGSSSPPQWFGLESTTWGNLRVGTLTGLHFVTGPDTTGATGSVYNSVQGIQGGNAAGGIYAMSTRMRNAAAWDSPTFGGGFKATVAYSSSLGAGTGDADFASPSRKGRAWNIIPQYITANWNVGYSHYDNKPDAPGVATVDEKGDRLYGEYRFGPWQIGGTWDRYKTKLSVGTAADVARRDAWSIQGGWTSGPHRVGVVYARAEKDKVFTPVGATSAGQDTEASSIGAAYQYSLSKRTNAFVSWYRLTNKSNAAYGAAGIPTPSYSIVSATAPVAGEDINMLLLGMNHSF